MFFAYVDALLSSGDLMEKPRNVILIVADSLRHDSVYSGPVGMPYVESRAIRYMQARSGGCWTLPSTASLFSGLVPHEHGATAQTRAIRNDVPTLAEGMLAAGYRTHQATANAVTTDLFGLNRGFEDIRSIWNLVKPRYRLMDQLLVLAGKPRLRRKLFSKDFIMGKMAGDFSVAKVWMQSTCQDVFGQARQILAENEAKNQRTFLFLNIMETHFPYHIGPEFKLLSKGAMQKMRELAGLYHLANQTWLTTGKEHIRQDMLDILRRRQRLAWEFLAPQLDAFLQEIHEQTGNAVVFCSDHGDNFGDQGWLYHFSNVTDGGNRVPLFWLPHDDRPAAQIETPVSTRDIYTTLLGLVGRPEGRPILLDDPQDSIPLMSSFWYNNNGRTLPQYRHNQLAFLENGMRYRLLGERWSAAPPQVEGPEATFAPLPADVNPIQDAVSDPTRRAQLTKYLADFHSFSEKLAA